MMSSLLAIMVRQLAELLAEPLCRLVNPKVCLLVVDPEKTARYLAIRGEVELIEEGALDHLDRLTRRYTRHPHYYGYVYPLEQQAQETRIICRIHATKITLDAIHT